MRTLCLGMLLLSLSQGASAQVTQQDLAAIRSLPWKEVNDDWLPLSNARLVSLPGFSVVTGSNAAHVRQLEDRDTDLTTEAVAYALQGSTEAIYKYQPSGFVSDTDWKAVDPQALLTGIKSNTEAANSSRASAGLPVLHVLNWIQPPRYNTNTHTVLWMFDAQASDGGFLVNAVALKLGRYGYERIVYVTSENNQAAAIAGLLQAADAHRFPAGSTYSDYAPGVDKAATFGVAGLIAGILGTSLVKTGAVVGLLVVAKKLLWLAVLPFIWAWRRMRRGKTAPAQKAADAPDLVMRPGEPESPVELGQPYSSHTRDF